MYQSERFGYDLTITSMPHVCKANRKLANKFSVEERVGYVHADVALEGHDEFDEAVYTLFDFRRWMSLRSFGLRFWLAFGNNGGMGCMISTVYDVMSIYRNIIYIYIAI